MVSDRKGGMVVWVALVMAVVLVPVMRGMEVVNGGYEDLVVAISPDLEEDANLIPGIKVSVHCETPPFFLGLILLWIKTSCGLS